jgi:hypothetical protein
MQGINFCFWVIQMVLLAGILCAHLSNPLPSLRQSIYKLYRPRPDDF